MTSQYRCETCKFYKTGIDGFGIWCPPMQIKEAHWFRRHDLNGMELENITKIIGCASHSDFPPSGKRTVCCASCPCRQPDCEDLCQHFNPPANVREKVLDEAIDALESTIINDIEDAKDAIESLRKGGE